MKIKKISMIFWAMMMAAVHTSGLMAMNNMINATALAEREKIEVTIAQAKVVIQTAQDTINDIRKEELLGTVKGAQALKQIRQQNAIIADAERTLGKMLKTSITVVESAEQEYSFITRAKEVGVQAVSLAKAGQIFSEKEKRLARRKIKRLLEQQEMLSKEYEDAISSAGDVYARGKLKKRYESIDTEINDKIREQEIIAGKAMSPAMRAFWKTVGVGALIATGRYFLGGTTDAGRVPTVPMPLQTSAHIPEQASTPLIPSPIPKTETILSSVPTSTDISPAIVQPPVITPDSVQMSEEKVLTPEERKMTMKKAIANFGWAALASAHAIFFAADFAATSTVLSILNPSVGFAGIAAASGAAGLSKIIQLMSEKEKTDFLRQPNPFFAR